MTYRVLTQLDLSDDAALSREQPLFAAGRDFAREFGGPITRAFLDALPPAWADLPLVFDSQLVGLPPGYDPGPMQFHREAYPEYSGAAFDKANAELDTESICCVFGRVMPRILVGAVDEAALPDASGWNKQRVSERDAALRAALEAGRLVEVSPAAGELWRIDGRTYLRWGRADVPALHFWMRATAGSQRPWANGRRNMGMKG